MSAIEWLINCFTIALLVTKIGEIKNLGKIIVWLRVNHLNYSCSDSNQNEE